MESNARSAGMPLPAKLSLLWICIVFNMVFADVLSFMYPGFLKEVLTGSVGGVHITAGFLVVAAILTEVPIAMIVLSRMLKQRANRWANIVAAVITIAFVIGGSTRYPHAIFFTAVQVACALLIVWSAWTWREPATSTERDLRAAGGAGPLVDDEVYGASTTLPITRR
jgi:hypothetical protein